METSMAGRERRGLSKRAATGAGVLTIACGQLSLMKWVKIIMRPGRKQQASCLMLSKIAIPGNFSLGVTSHFINES